MNDLSIAILLNIERGKWQIKYEACGLSRNLQHQSEHKIPLNGV